MLFSEMKRLFIETVSGCNSHNCTSPCSAQGKPLRMMDTDLFRELVAYFRQYDCEIHLFGQGDCSIFPFEEINIDYTGLIANLTPQYFYRLPILTALGLRVFLRYDSRRDLNVDVGGKLCGTFMVVGSRETDDYIIVAKTVLERGYPFMIRSMCNKPETNPPIPLDDVLIELKDNRVSYSRIVAGEHPMKNCNVLTVRQEGNKLLYKKCINHDLDFEVTNLDDIAKVLNDWDCVKNPEDFCFQCATNRENYRIYCEPETQRGNNIK